MYEYIQCYLIALKIVVLHGIAYASCIDLSLVSVNIFVLVCRLRKNFCRAFFCSY